MKTFPGLNSVRRGFLLLLGLTSVAVLLPRSGVVGTHPNNAPFISVSICDAPTVVPDNTGLSNYSPALCFDYAGLQPGLYTLKAYLLQWKTNPGTPPCGSNQWCGDGPTADPPAVFPIDNSTGTNSAGRIVEIRNMGTFLVSPYTSFMWVIDLYNQNQPTVPVASATQPASATMNNPPVLNPIGNKTGNAGVPLQFTVSASDIEGDALALSVQNLPSGATFNAATGVFNWPAPVAGTYSSIIFKTTQTAGIPLSDAERISIQISSSSNQVLSLSSNTYKSGEGGPATIIVNRTGGSAGTVSVDYSTANITATAGADYIATSGNLSFGDGVTKKIISVPILNDATVESNETFNVTLSNPTGGAVLGTSTATVTIVDDDTSSVSGQWGPLIQWQTLPIHMHLLPTGKVMFWDRHDDPNSPKGWDGNPWIWDPAPQTFTMLPHPSYDVFCSGHTFMADGKLIVTGGHHMANDVGETAVSVYDPVANSWTSLPNMNAGRWYPTNTLLANGDILVLAGTMNGFNDVNRVPQVWETASGTWRYLSTATFQGNAPVWPDYYPFTFLSPNGKVFDAGPQQMSRYLDTSGTGGWTDVANSSLIYRDYGSSVMYADGKVLIVGGNPRDPDNVNVLPSATAEVIDLNNSTPTWRPISPMSVGRRHLNTTLLPDGQVLVTGGSSYNGHDNSDGKVLYAEMWDPATEAWTPMAGYTRYRGYHSNALLLPDGRVLIAGGGHPDPLTGAEQNAEIYSPPYLFKGARPTITSAPAHTAYGQALFVQTPTPNITKVTLIRLSSVTHAFNQNQRINNLTFSQTSGGLLVTAPSSANLCPPGDYMLFILNSNGVPSVARFIRVSASLPLRTLTVSSSNPGSGVSVAVIPNDNNGQGNGATQFTRTYNDTAAVSLTAPATVGGNNFQKWQRDGVDFATSVTASFTMDADHTMTAVYVPTNQGTCANPYNLSAGQSFNGNTSGGQSSFGSYNCVTWNESGPERVHTITLASPGTLTVALSNLGVDLDVFVLSSCSANSCSAFGDNLASVNLGPGTYYVVVDGFNGAVGGYTLSVSVSGSAHTATVGLYDPATSTFFLKNSNSAGPGDSVFGYGPPGAGWVPLAGDWNGDGTDTIGLYNSATSTFFLKNTNSAGPADLVFPYGPAGAGWTPIVGDWDGNGTDTVGLFNPTTSTFLLKNTNAPGPGDLVFVYGPGGVGWKPLVGDWNADGTDTVGLYNPSTSTFFLKNTNSAGPGDLVFGYGPAGAGWLPLTGDWNGDGVDTVGLYNPTTGFFFLKNTNAAGPGDLVFVYGPVANWTPIVGDWDGM